MTQISPIFKREFVGYFRTPVAYVFLVAFLIISVALALSRFGGFFQAGIASLDAYFGFFPWLYLFIVPAIGMRLWSEEKRSGTAELLFTLPVTTLEAVIGKFFAGGPSSPSPSSSAFRWRSRLATWEIRTGESW